MSTPARRRSAAMPLAIMFAVAFAGAAAITSRWPAAAPHAPIPPPGALDAAPAPAVTAAAGAAAAAVGPTPAREAVPAAPAAPERSFAERVDELVRIGIETAQLAQQDDLTAARASDQRARTNLAELLATFGDAGERALAMVVELPDPAPLADPPDPLVHGRRIVLQLVLAAELDRRDQAAEAMRDRARIDALTHAVLGVMPGNATTAALGEAVLAKQRFLRAVHEPDVLGLVQLAGEAKFPRPTATRLLLTLWDNLQRGGERSSAELSQLALALLGDGDVSKRAAASRQLLQDPRYRALVLASLRERDDRAVAHEVANLAAQELPVADALALLRELAPTLQRAPQAYLMLGFRAPMAVADSYRSLLASDTCGDVRCDLVAGIGMARTPLGLEIAQLALDRDPSPDVRLQALFALAAHDDPERAALAFDRVLDDPAIAGDAARLGAVVLALQNLEARADPNLSARIVQRLRALRLLEASHATLVAIEQRCLPGGGATAPAGDR
jgi:hypothetical protein